MESVVPGVGWVELLVIAAVALVVVGPEKLPEMLRGLARFYRGLRQAFIKAQSTVSVEMVLLEQELSQAAEPEKMAPPPQTPEAPQADKTHMLSDSGEQNR